MIFRISVLSVFLFCTIVSSGFAGDMSKAPYKGSSEFEQLKTLEGRWEGKGKMGAIETPVTVEYKITSNGSALVERLFAGTPQEMTTVYTDRDSKVSLTHYCSIGNQPQMDLVKQSGMRYEFMFSKKSNFNPKKEGHMHALTIDYDGQDRLVHQWDMFEKGKSTGVHGFEFKRVEK
jgi:hypothetical protein